MNQQTTRRDFLDVTTTMAAAGLGWAFSRRESTASPVSPRSIPKMKITRAESVMTGSEVFVRIETDAGPREHSCHHEMTSAYEMDPRNTTVLPVRRQG
jgi:hypothetical protein